MKYVIKLHLGFNSCVFKLHFSLVLQTSNGDYCYDLVVKAMDFQSADLHYIANNTNSGSLVLSERAPGQNCSGTAENVLDYRGRMSEPSN